MDLFSWAQEQEVMKAAPLAARMRPRALNDFVGQEQLLGHGKVLRRAIENDHLTSMVFFGPPGCGKTTLARVIANQTRAQFVQLSAVTAGVADLRRIIEQARQLRRIGQRTILFIDEIHRFNKAQQDALLPAVEDGVVTLIGATTENPFFSVNSALLSRLRLYHLNPLNEEEVGCIITLALQDRERGLGGRMLELEPAAFTHLVATAAGDARVALNALELAANASGKPDREAGVAAGQRTVITRPVLEDALQNRTVLYDRGGDQHYDVISAFIKSLRGSDPQAALHYLARMLAAGEEPRFICRRMIILAAEDIGLADPQALQVAVAAAQALDMIGLPEGRLPMAEAAIYLAAAPKSNSVISAIDQALADVAGKDIGQVPSHLRDSHYRGAQALGHGQGYLYPHDFPGNYVQQQYLPDALLGRIYYQPGTNGREKEIRGNHSHKNEKRVNIKHKPE